MISSSDRSHRSGSPHSADLFLADDRRAWRPGRPLQGLWQRLRLVTLTGHLRHTRSAGTASSTAASPGCVSAHPRAHAGRRPAGLAVAGRGPGGLQLSVVSGNGPKAEQASLRGALVPPRGVLCTLPVEGVGPRMHWTIAALVPLPL